VVAAGGGPVVTVVVGRVAVVELGPAAVEVVPLDTGRRGAAGGFDLLTATAAGGVAVDGATGDAAWRARSG
jgi:hypothetical protein